MSFGFKPTAEDSCIFTNGRIVFFFVDDIWDL